MSDKSILHLNDVCKEIYNNDDCSNILCDDCPLSHEEIATKILINYIKDARTPKTKFKLLKYKLFISKYFTKNRTLSFPKWFSYIKNCVLYIPRKIKKIAKWWWNKWT